SPSQQTIAALIRGYIRIGFRISSLPALTPTGQIRRSSGYDSCFPHGTPPSSRNAAPFPLRREAERRYGSHALELAALHLPSRNLKTSQIVQNCRISCKGAATCLYAPSLAPPCWPQRRFSLRQSSPSRLSMRSTKLPSLAISLKRSA